MSQSDSEQQLRIWKDLAISKQVLMNEAASALKLKDDFTADDLRDALEHAIKRAHDADMVMAEGREAAKAQVDEMQRTVKLTDKARLEAENQRDTANQQREAAEQALAIGRKDNADAIKKAKRQVEDKQKELKAINTALADTPDNIIKKLKALKKQKLDEANARKTAEDANRKLKKDNKEQQAELDTLSSLKDDTARLVESHRELGEWADSVQKTLEGSDVSVDAPPAVDAELIASIEAVISPDKEEADTREAATA